MTSAWWLASSQCKWSSTSAAVSITDRSTGMSSVSLTHWILKPHSTPFTTIVLPLRQLLAESLVSLEKLRMREAFKDPRTLAAMARSKLLPSLVVMKARVVLSWRVRASSSMLLVLLSSPWPVPSNCSGEVDGWMDDLESLILIQWVKVDTFICFLFDRVCFWLQLLFTSCVCFWLFFLFVSLIRYQV